MIRPINLFASSPDKVGVGAIGFAMASSFF